MHEKTKEETRQTKTALAHKLGISRGMLYYKHRKPVEDEKLKVEIEKVLFDHPSYGHRRIAMELGLNRKRIRRLIKNFCPIRSNIVWVGDFTHIRFGDCWVYLATVMDIYTREIVGWHLANTHAKDLVIDAFLDALDKRRQAPVYFHSDQGSEYESDEYLKLLEDQGIIISMSRKSSPWENGYQESFYSGFKLDLGPTNHYQDLGELIEAVARTIHYYNTERIHTKLKTSPEKFRLSREYLFKEMGT